MHIHPASIVGASGYTGLELTRLLARHPQVRVASLYSDRWADEAAGARLPLAGELAALRYRPLSEAERAEGEIVFLATPAEVSAHLAPKLLARGARVVDLSGAFRLAEPADYPAWYGFAHPAPELLAEARYGLPELAQAGLAGARLVTNPGCYATSIALAVAPLVKAGLASPDGIVVTGLSGVSGAGRKASEDYSFAEVEGDLRAYRLGRHQHVPEIEQTVRRHAGACGPIAFAPVLVPIRRGISPRSRSDRERRRAGRSRGALRAAYGGERSCACSRRTSDGEGRAPRTSPTSASPSMLARACGARHRRHRQPREGCRDRAVQAMNAAMGWPSPPALDLVGG
jgi:N-acetyl-gamma-glutamyl-phosphate reductase